jgi:hypothetical protein
MCVYIIGGHNTDVLEAFNDFGANWAWLSIEGEVWVIVGLHVERLEVGRNDLQQAQVQKDVVYVGPEACADLWRALDLAVEPGPCAGGYPA